MPFRFPAPLYPIADGAPGAEEVVAELARAILGAGAPLLQLRVKHSPTGRFVELAHAVKAMADRHGARLIINDRADVARVVDAAGVHLGQDDVPPGAARQLLGSGKIVGLSTHSAAQVRQAVRAADADYLAFGPIYPTASKASPDPAQGIDGLYRAREICPLPLVAIGGIGPCTVAEVLETGVDAVAVIGAIAGAADPGAAAADLLQRTTDARAHHMTVTASRYRHRRRS